MSTHPPSLHALTSHALALTFLLGALPRLIPALSANLTAHQRSKTPSGVDPDGWLLVTGVLNLLIAALVLWPRTRRVGAACGVLYLCVGVWARVREGRGVWPALVVGGLGVGVVVG
ncbi:MAG: hypothetical protein M1828_002565 [Chrysothrix sp. TS-e1954]|nr:MAG: hypothetical protein M1828_002565 [Chrysothrix sp. TS-e1954]